MAKSKRWQGAHVGRLLMLVIVVVGFTIATLVIVELIGGAKQFRGLIENAGPWAPLLYVLLKASTYVIAPLSGTSVKLASGALFGAWEGMILSLAGDTLGSTLNYWIARTFGRKGIKRFAGKQAISQVDDVASRVGGWRMLLSARILLPFYDFISYAAGLARFPFQQFLIVTVVGGIPLALIFALVGDSAVESSAMSHILIGIFAVVFVGAVIAYLFFKKQQRALGKEPALEDSLGE